MVSKRIGEGKNRRKKELAKERITYIGNLQLGKVEGTVIHILIHQLANIIDKAFGIDHRRRGLGSTFDQQTSGFVSIAFGNSHEQVNEILLLGLLQNIYQTAVQKYQLGMNLPLRETAMADGLGERNLAGDLVAYEDVSRMKIRVQEVVHQEHVKEAENA